MTDNNIATVTERNGSSVKTATGRILSIDIMRGFALICMVLVHFTIYYCDEAAADTFTVFFFGDVLADWGAAAFLMMMGISQVLSEGRTGRPDNRLLFKRALIRGSYLFITGLLMLLLAFGPGRVWRWDILTLMGTVTVVLFFCRFLPSWALVVLSAAIALTTPPARDFFDIALSWGGGFKPEPFISRILPGMSVVPVNDYSSIWNFSGIVKGFFFSGYFPLLPWVIFPIVGLILGRRIIEGKLNKDLPVLFVTGAAFLCVGFGLAYAASDKPPDSVVNSLISPMCFYPDSFSMINIQAGMSIIVFGMMYFFYDVRKKDKTALSRISRLYVRTSNFSLSFYFMHYMLLGWPIAILYLLTGKYLYGDMLGANQALLCGIAAVIILEIIIFFWEKADSKYSLEWLLAAITVSIAPGYKRSIEKTTPK
jgi:uncharacterized membrane protein